MEVYLYVVYDKICTRMWCIHDVKTSEVQETKYCERAHVVPGGLKGPVHNYHVCFLKRGNWNGDGQSK